MTILSLVANPKDVRNVMPPPETHITKKEKIRIAKYLLKYIDEPASPQSYDLKGELKEMIDLYASE